MALRKDEEMGVAVVAGDVEIGAVEVKDGTADNRLAVDSSGALRAVIQTGASEIGAVTIHTGASEIGAVVVHSGASTIGDVTVSSIPGTAASGEAAPAVGYMVSGVESGSATPLQLDGLGNLRVAQQIQNYPSVWSYSGSLGDTDTISGSRACAGYSKLCGMVWSSCTGETASAVMVQFSTDSGDNWDYVSASDGLTASTAAACCTDIVGTSVKVSLQQGTASGDLVRAEFWLRPV